MRPWQLFGLALLAGLVVAACFQARSEICESGIVCPADSHCATRQDVCITGSCGNGVIDRDEVCDDGNVIPGDGCSADCKSKEICGNGITDIEVGEVCDDGNTRSDDGCSFDCRSKEGCGNGKLDQGEGCDDGNDAGDDFCTPLCKNAICGDGFVNDAGTPDGGHVEICDTAMNPTTACPYGQTCPVCAGCTAIEDVQGPHCGDGIVERNREVCDDGNNVTEDACPYGADGGRCTLCRNDCMESLPLAGPYCGDGAVQSDGGAEACDDGNTVPCGTCSPDCKVSQLGAATGRIIAIKASDIVDGESFTLDDGNAGPVVFELHSGAGSDAGVIRVAISSNADSVAGQIKDAINSSGIQITATKSGNQVSLSNDNIGNRGNRPITESVANSNFLVFGMSGGGGSDCPAGVGCASDLDCDGGLTCQSDGGRSTCQ